MLAIQKPKALGTVLIEQGLLRSEQVAARRMQLKLWVAGAVVWQAISLVIALLFFR